jgi:PIN domain
VRLKNPGELQKALDTLDARARELRRVFEIRPRFSSHCRRAWLRWWELADSSFREVFADDDLVTPLYRTAQEVRAAIEGTWGPVEIGMVSSSTPGSSGDTMIRNDPVVMSLLNRTRDVWVDRLETAADQLRMVQRFVNRSGRIAVLDTSAFLEGRKFYGANWPELLDEDPRGEPQLAVRLVVPLVVVEELDEGKNSKVNRVQERSKDALRELWKLRRIEELSSSLVDVLKLDTRVTVEILMDSASHTRLPVNDFEITDRALFVQEMVTSPRRVRLVAGDYSMLFRGRSLGLDTLQIPRLESGNRGDDSSSAAIQTTTG